MQTPRIHDVVHVASCYRLRSEASPPPKISASSVREWEGIVVSVNIVFLMCSKCVLKSTPSKDLRILRAIMGGHRCHGKGLGLRV